MGSNTDFVNRLKEIMDINDIEIDAPMVKYTSFKVGGPVDYLVNPGSYQQVSDIVKLCRKLGMPYYIIGNCSNLIVKDGGFRGTLIKLSKLNKIYIEGNRITSQSGTLLKSVSNAALEESLTGFEFASGIPGSVGGAIYMNAGAYDGEISKVIEDARVLDNNGEIKNLTKEELELGYRSSSVQTYGYVILEATFKLNPGDKEKIRNRIIELTNRRCDKQPLEFPSAGSTFKRPEGFFAAKLIEDTGLKGLTVGEAEVSTKHSGFLINKGGASAKDVIDLITLVQERVKEKFNVDLHPEVRIIGEDK
ncbi:MAG: UDP-N-acetylmuramate dehydrogenase [Bacillota bacterium]|nr:UDP-N-acetylmuramate dehydrogenase [Bacillota bacterium]